MYVKRNYGFLMTFNWSRKPFLIGSVYSLVICGLAYFLPFEIDIPWQPISVLGIAVSFYLGFKNNSSYDRTWEARKIWGSIVNNSRSFAAAVMAFTEGTDQKEIQKELIYRHIAWLTSLRHQLRLSREWEHKEIRLNGLYSPTVCEDYTDKLENELAFFLAAEEIEALSSSKNRATQIMAKQSKRLQEIRNAGYFDDFRHMQLHKLIVTFYEDQGKSERIKNFPIPRQYASTALWLTTVFAAFVPFGLLNILELNHGFSVLLSAALGGLIIWVFFLMEKIGDYSENPFEGTYNDVPITSIARAIEIDLREMLGDTNIPGPVQAENGFLM